jgi:hypothetical protein
MKTKIDPKKPAQEPSQPVRPDQEHEEHAPHQRHEHAVIKLPSTGANYVEPGGAIPNT